EAGGCLPPAALFLGCWRCRESRELAVDGLCEVSLGGRARHVVVEKKRPTEESRRGRALPVTVRRGRMVAIVCREVMLMWLQRAGELLLGGFTERVAKIWDSLNLSSNRIVSMRPLINQLSAH